MKYLLSTIASVLIIGCAKPSGESDSLKPPEGKPLPDECVSEVSVSLVWEKYWKSQQYVLSFSTRPDAAPFLEARVEGSSDGYHMTFPRGTELRLKASRVLRDGKSEMESKAILIPSCETRTIWRIAHPDYEEPIKIFLKWGR